MGIKFIEIKKTPILDQYHCEKIIMLYMYAYFNMEKYWDYNHSTLQPCRKLVFDDYLYICGIPVLPYNYYCTCIYMYLLYASK